MMQATDWQQHSVRGFLAGTVKKKLGFPLTSLKPNDGARRYRIETGPFHVQLTPDEEAAYGAWNKIGRFRVVGCGALRLERLGRGVG